MGNYAGLLINDSQKLRQHMRETLAFLCLVRWERMYCTSKPEQKPGGHEPPQYSPYYNTHTLMGDIGARRRYGE